MKLYFPSRIPCEALDLVIFSFSQFQRAGFKTCDIKCLPDDKSGQIEPNIFLQP